jgi:hypothetical protein
MTQQIVLTDWPKTKHLDANYRGVETEKLLKWRDELFHLMMVSGAEEAGGYTVHYEPKGIDEELAFRKALPKDRR